MLFIQIPIRSTNPKIFKQQAICINNKVAIGFGF